MAAQEDEGLTKFRALVAALTRTVGTMQEHNETLDTESSTLSDLEDTAEDKLSDVEEKLGQGQEDVDAAHDEAVEEIDDLVGAAHDGVTDTLDDAVKSIDAAEERFGSALQSATEDLDEGHEDLGERGFSGLASDLDVVEQALKQATSDVDASGNSFEQAVQADAGNVERELDEAEAKVEAAAAETRRELEEAQNQAKEDGQSFDDMAAAFGSACETVFGDLDRAYDDLDGNVQDDVKGMGESIRNSVKAEAKEIEAGAATQIEQPTDSVVDTDAPTFTAQVDVAEAAVRAVMATGEEMAKTVDNLLVCQQVCDTIKETLAAME